MKKLIFLMSIVLTAVCVMGCKTENPEPNPVPPTPTHSMAEAVMNLTPDFITVSGIEADMAYTPGTTEILHITPAQILSAGFRNYHAEHIHIHVNDRVYMPEIPIGDEETLDSVDVEIEIPEDEFFSVVACYSVQQQFSDSGYTMLLEENDDVKLYGVDPERKYKYFDCYLLTPDAYTITDVEFKVGGSSWQKVNEVTGCSFTRSESVENVYNITVRPDYAEVTGDVTLRVVGEQHGRYAITWENATEKYLDLEKSILPEKSIDGETVTAELWVNDGYYLASAEASVSSVELSVIARAYVRFEMPAEDVTITLNIEEEISVNCIKGANISTVELYNAPDLYYGVPTSTGIPGEEVYLFASSDTGYKPSKAVAEGGESYDFVFYAPSIFYAPITIPEGVKSLTVQAEAVKAYTAIGDGNIYFDAGNIYAEGETVSVTVGVPQGGHVKSVSVKTADGRDVAVTEDLPYATFVMPDSDVYVTAQFDSIGGDDTVSVIAYFDEDQYDISCSTNYDWDFAEGFTVDRGTTFYVSIYNYDGDAFYVGVKIGDTVNIYKSELDDMMGEYSFGKAFVAEDDVVIKIGASEEEVAFDSSSASKTVSVIAYFDDDSYEVRSSTNYGWDFAEGFTVDRGTTFYLSVYNYDGYEFFVGVKIGDSVNIYAADFDEDMGEASFGRALVADDDMVIKVGETRDEVSF